MNPPDPARLSVQLWSLRNEGRQGAFEVLERLAALGFQFIEPYGIGNRSTAAEERLKSARDLQAVLETLGLGVSGVHATAPLDGKDADTFRELELLKTDLCIVPSPNLVRNSSFESFHKQQDTIALADSLNAAAALCARHGVTLGYHNHAAEWHELENGQLAYDVLIDHLDPAIKIELDIYWAQIAGQSPARVLERLGDRVVALHLKDGHHDVSPDQPQTPLGEGLVDYRAAVHAAPSALWHILEMDHSSRIYADLEQSAAQLVGQGLSRWH
ncbi:sugar phosphate isomerase/epimerase family protein [Deinococcus marmoris]|uniref:Xylose isomerase domain protein TIM barrel n=1 Tax=Deinococcus marmoris TaxID=249408 RepID=A0A1U7NVI2_9DEIO|nr:sugar phosphate isomerase/epimerase [Deinococcus marmoris]OLV16938.1 Xylose isomerase domain protein TIM barrel [Deinococcus marmoris]